MSEITMVDTRGAALLETWKLDHPKAIDATIVPVDGAVYKITTEGATFRAEVMDNGTRGLYTWCDPGDLSIALGQPVMRRLVGPAEPQPVRDASVFDVASARRQSHFLLDQIRHVSERLRIALKNVATSHSDEVCRLSALVPADAVDASYRTLDYTVELRRMSREALETVAMLTGLRVVLGEAEMFRRMAAPSLRTAIVGLENARRGLGHLSEVGSLSTLGDVAVDRHSQHEANLDDLSDRLDTLRRSVEEAAPLVSRFEAALQTHVSAMLHVTRLATVASATSTLTKLRAMAEAIRVESEAEILAREAAERMNVTAPKISWPRDLLEVPKLGG